MDELIMALGPVFAAGFAIEQLLEVIGAFLGKIIPATKDPGSEWKKIVLGLLSFGCGLVLARFAGIRVLQPFDVAAADWADILTTALVISAGTEGLNSIVKFIRYAKEDKKADAKKNTVEAKAKANGIDF